MRYIIPVFLLCILSFTVHGQKRFVKPNYEEIKKEIASDKSPFYYPALLKRYQADDSTLSLADYKHLYYGFFFNEKYSSFGNIDASLDKEIKAIAGKRKLSNKDRAALVKLYQKKLEAGNPFDLRALTTIYSFYSILKDEQNKRIYDIKLDGIINAIMSTGDGKTEETAMHILSVTDEYSMVSILGYETTGHQTLTEKTCDHLALQKNNDGITGLYFDVNQIFAGYQEMFKEK
jgi:hypothetical protein